jgi:hypothetical protein
MALNGISINASKSKEHQTLLPFDSLLLRKLAFSKLVDSTAKRALLSRIVQRELLEKTRKCIKS